MPYLILAVLTAVLIAAIVATAALRTVYDQRQQLGSEDSPPPDEVVEGANLAWGVVGVAILAIVCLILAGCEPLLPEFNADNPANHVYVWHDDHRATTCWQLGGSNGGISCLPDWMLKPTTQEQKP